MASKVLIVLWRAGMVVGYEEKQKKEKRKKKTTLLNIPSYRKPNIMETLVLTFWQLEMLQQYCLMLYRKSEVQKMFYSAKIC